MRFQSVTTNIQSATAVYCKCSGFCAVALNCKCTKTHKKASIFFLLQVQWVTLRRDTNPVLVGFPSKFDFDFVQWFCTLTCFLSALKKIRQIRVQSIIPVGCRLETEGYMTLPRASLSIINFQNLHVKKGSVSHAHEIHFLCAPVLCDPLEPPPSEKVKTLM